MILKIRSIGQNHFILKYDEAVTSNKTSLVLASPSGAVRYRILCKTLRIREFSKFRTWKCTCAPIWGSTGRQISYCFDGSKIQRYTSVILQSHRIWMDSGFSSSIWISISPGRIFKHISDQLNIKQNQGHFEKIHKSQLFPECKICIWRGHYHYEKVAQRLRKGFPHPHCLRKVDVDISGTLVDERISGKCSKSRKTTFSNLWVHRSPTDPQLNFAHFITWVYWDCTRCKKSEVQFPDRQK